MSRVPGVASRFRSATVGLIDTLRDYLGIGRKVRKAPIRDPEALREFLDSRASFIAQTSLYGYLRTRAGLRYPALFDDDAFVVSIDIAKWHMWLACLSDISVYAGGLLLRRGPLTEAQVGTVIEAQIERILAETGVPDTAGEGFAEHADRVRARVASTTWHRVQDDESCFRESPSALVQYAPVVEEFKRLDEEIVRNSVRFHWQEIRRDLRHYLDAEAMARATQVD